MSQAMDNYIAKMATLDTTRNTVQHLIGSLRAFAEPLIRNWKTCYIQLSGAGMPMGITSGRQPIDGNNVPPVISLHNALVEHFSAQQEAKLAYNKMSNAERSQMKEPHWD